MSAPLMNKTVRSVCVFCASSSEISQEYFEMAETLGAMLAKAGVRLVYGGAQGGLMGACADAALAEGGEVIGVIPKVLSSQERAHKKLSTLHVTPDMHTRQQKMAQLADMFVILPGGLGTLAEFFEIVTWKQIGLHDKPIVVVNTNGYWDGLAQMLDQCESQGFFHGELTDLILIVDSSQNIEVIKNFFTTE